MEKEVSVEQAIKKGHRMVTYPGMALMFGLMGVSIYISMQHSLPLWPKPTSLVLSLTLPWLYWSYMIVKWRLWAYSRVRNVHELEHKAVEALLLWPRGSFFERTEIRSAEDKAALALLEEKLSLPDVYDDDPLVPQETTIHYSANKDFIQFLIYAVLLGGYVGYCIVNNERPYFMLLLLLVSLGFAVYYYRQHSKMKRRGATIVLKDEGIETVSAGFREWDEISDERVALRDGSHYLVFEHDDGYEQINLDEYKVRGKEVEHLIRTYRARHTGRRG